MHVEYDSNDLERLCTDEKEMKRERSDLVKKLPLRIKALEEAQSVSHLKEHDPLGHWHQLTGDWEGHWAGSVSKNHRIIIRPEGVARDALGEAVFVTVVEAGYDYH
ncbi:type II toxin-antitoxin system RelE/ParE family toxin [Litorihabitans aurantiacus]|uniref:Proteic killer suppression protein n=1 Tax=Litorihabitans aurantiacus TaxID=1930061 RepID=A0AA37XI43_9MICO|nr:type II toxin-antitoxin system RelE/ParE family toxin [Litorihabitans aurantiacus]GMA33494.1 hypothetical protein GCM10025875_34860 [Litorihabitans aurantiacus]GMA33601.1 hypothetical protein GCM10025875_35930 [Litorihabitans aurantiacus]